MKLSVTNSKSKQNWSLGQNQGIKLSKKFKVTKFFRYLGAFYSGSQLGKKLCDQTASFQRHQITHLFRDIHHTLHDFFPAHLWTLRKFARASTQSNWQLLTAATEWCLFSSREIYIYVETNFVSESLLPMSDSFALYIVEQEVPNRIWQVEFASPFRGSSQVLTIGLWHLLNVSLVGCLLKTIMQSFSYLSLHFSSWTGVNSVL